LGVLLVLTEHAVIAPTGGGAHTVAGDRDRRLQRHPCVQLAVDQPFLSTVQALQVFANALLADVDPIAAELDRPVIGKQIGRLAPKPAIDVESERALQLLDGARPFEPLDALRQLLDPRVQVLRTGRCRHSERHTSEQGVPADPPRGPHSHSRSRRYQSWPAMIGTRAALKSPNLD